MRLRALSEEECYTRCYGWRGQDDTVKVLREAPGERAETGLVAERVRLALERALDARESEAA